VNTTSSISELFDYTKDSSSDKSLYRKQAEVYTTFISISELFECTKVWFSDVPSFRKQAEENTTTTSSISELFEYSKDYSFDNC
jgi:hypothetical protein